MIFTDWTMTSPHYFFMRGALWGCVASTLFWMFFIPWFKKKLNLTQHPTDLSSTSLEKDCEHHGVKEIGSYT